MGFQSIDVRKLTPAIGAEKLGVDLPKPLGNQVLQEIHDALMVGHRVTVQGDKPFYRA